MGSPWYRHTGATDAVKYCHYVGVSRAQRVEQHRTGRSNVEYKTGILDQYKIHANLIHTRIIYWSVSYHMLISHQCAERTILFMRPRVIKLISVVYVVQILSYNLLHM